MAHGGLRIWLALMLVCAAASAATPNLKDNIERPLRYRPEGGGFVIENGPDSFNRPLYGGNTAFRVDAGDRPEFSLYVPGRGGNLRLGIKTATSAKWLNDMDRIVARYVDGSMRYEIRDAILRNGIVRIEALGLNTTEGLVIRVDAQGIPDDAEFIFAFGGANGDRGSRSGDIGTEREPVSRFFALRPEYCRNNRFEINGSGFILQSRPAPGKIAGVMPAGSQIAIGDAAKWASPGELLGSGGQVTQTPVVVGNAKIQVNQPMYIALQRLADETNQPAALEAPRVSALQEAGPESGVLLPAFAVADLGGVFEKTRQHFREISHRVTVDTPDEFINSAVPALCLASDAIWDEPGQAIMHGGVAWRTKLLGWRGPYTADALGWHDRIVKHLNNWFTKQNVDPIDPTKTGADADSDLARSEALLHTNGDLTRSHYDMNMVAIDALFRHLLWTGDVEYARATFPVVKRHLAWEQRLFRREFGPEKLPLYEGYACIWASDDLGYNGGGATHSTAYNYWHNVMAARIAQMIGEDPAMYAREAELIQKAMKQYLWLADRGWYAEYKDLLGNQLAHPSAALWTHYHAIDEKAADPFQAWQMSRYIDTQITHIPLKGAGVPEGYFNLASTTWMPYTWSINNVAMAETVHTALSEFQTGRTKQAFATLKGALLDSMFIGQCPGNLHMASHFDPNRRESQRDSGDPIGITSRTLIEGLFGIEPDALAGDLIIRPGFPAEWDHASIKHPDVSIAYRHTAPLEDRFEIESRFPKPMRLRLHIPARAVEVASIVVNGQLAEWKNIDDAIGAPRIEVMSPAAARWDVVIRFANDPPASIKPPAVYATGSMLNLLSPLPATFVDVRDPQLVLEQTDQGEHLLRATISKQTGARTVFVKLHQGQLTWWQPLEFEVRPPLEIIDAGPGRFRVRNNTASPIHARAMLRPPLSRSVTDVPLDADAFSDSGDLPIVDPVPGTNQISLTIGNYTIEGVQTNWRILSTRPRSGWEMVDLSAAFNDRVTQIFKNRYLSPRSPSASLSIPADGIGGWATFARTADIDDTGLRQHAAQTDGVFPIQGIPFKTTGDATARNIAFTSQWDNYPHEISIPLTGASSHAYLLMAGSTNPMQSRFDNGEVIVTYTDGSTERLALANPTNWWPIERDYFVDDYSFARPEPVPPRIDLRTGTIRITDPTEIKGGRETIPGGAATLLDLPLDSGKQLRTVTVRTLANEVVIGVMGITLAR